MSKKNEAVEVVVLNTKVSPKTAFINNYFATGGNDIGEALKSWAESRGDTGAGFKAEFFAELERGVMDAAALDTFLADRSDNVKKNKANWDGIRKMANRIHEKV